MPRWPGRNEYSVTVTNTQRTPPYLFSRDLNVSAVFPRFAAAFCAALSGAHAQPPALLLTPIMGKTPSFQLGSLGKKSKKKPQLAEGDGGSAGPGGSGAEDEYKAALALSKRLDAEAAAGPWKAVQLQKGDEGYNFNTRFKQQRYKVNTAPWQSPLFMLAFGLLVGVVFLSFGGVMLETAEGLHVVRKVYDCFHEDAKHEGECACDGMASCTTPLEVPPGWTVLTQREPSP